MEQGIAAADSVIDDQPYGTDLNNYVTTGIYSMPLTNTGISNTPLPSSDKFILYVFTYGYYVYQIAIGTMGLAVRYHYDNGQAISTWYDWKLFTVEQSEVDQCLNLGEQGSLLSQNTDLNNVKTFGQYVVTTDLTLSTLVNCPVFDTKFMLIVMPAETTSYAIQVIIPNDGSRIYMRRISTTGSTTTQWREFGSTPVQTVFTQQPQNVSNAHDGDSVEFVVKASGENLTYKWQFYNPNNGSWSNFTQSSTGVSGYDTDTLTVTVTTSRNRFQYHCIVTKSDSTTITSRNALLTVLSN